MVDPPPATAPPLVVDHLTIAYGDRPAVRDLSFTVRRGEVYGLLGSNGAGKSSTIKAIVGLVRPVAGRLGVFGADPTAEETRTKEWIGYVPETSLLYEALTPREFLEFVASVRRLPADAATHRGRALAAALRLEEEVDHPIATLSNGTRQKVLLAAALLHEPPLLVLDEPLAHLDPRTARLMKELLARYVAVGHRGILFSTHTMEVAEQLCTRVGILDHGVLRGEGTLAELRERSARGDATLEEIFLHLTEDAGDIPTALDSLERA